MPSNDTSSPLPFKLDMHTHMLPERWPDLRQRYGYGGFVRLEHHKPGAARMMIDDRFFREVQANCWQPEARFADCKHTGVSVQVLSTVPVMFNYHIPPRDNHDLAQWLNDDLAQVVSRHPEHFIGLGTLPMQDPELAALELERCVKTLGMPGVQIGSHINRWNLEDQALQPFYEAANELEAAVFIHPWDMVGKEKMPKYWLPWLVGMPAETTLAACSLIFGGILERYPKIRFCFSHAGGNLAFTIGRIEHGFRVRPDLCAIDNPVNPREYLSRIYVDSITHDQAALRYLLDTFPPSRVMMGSDYPFPLGEHNPGALIESLELDAATTDQLLWKSALEWLRPHPDHLRRLALPEDLSLNSNH